MFTHVGWESQKELDRQRNIILDGIGRSIPASIKVDKNLFDSMDDIMLEPGGSIPVSDSVFHAMNGTSFSGASTSSNIVDIPRESTEFDLILDKFNDGIKKFDSMLPQEQIEDWKVMSSFYYGRIADWPMHTSGATS